MSGLCPEQMRQQQACSRLAFGLTGVQIKLRGIGTSRSSATPPIVECTGLINIGYSDISSCCAWCVCCVLHVQAVAARCESVVHAAFLLCRQMRTPLPTTLATYRIPAFQMVRRSRLVQYPLLSPCLICWKEGRCRRLTILTAPPLCVKSSARYHSIAGSTAVLVADTQKAT